MKHNSWNIPSLLVGMAAILLLAACQPIRPVTPPPAAPVLTATSPVEFVLQITGDPNPLSGPTSLDLDGQGQLYVVDGLNNRIQVFDASGYFLRMWGSRGNADGQFDLIDPVEGYAFGSVAVDGQGNVYVVDTFNQRIQQFTSDGRFLAEWGSDGTGDGQFLRPYDVAVDAQGAVYVIDDRRNDIQKFTGTGQFLAKWAGHGLDDGELNETGPLVVDEQGHVYVADFGNNRVQKFDSNGKFLAKWGHYGFGDGQFNRPSGVAVDTQGHVYVSEWDGGRVQQFDATGQFLVKWGSYGKGAGQFIHPLEVVVDDQGDVYVIDYGNNRIQKFRQKD